MTKMTHSASTIADEARAWLVRMQGGQVCAGDRERFQQWLDASEEHRRAFQKATALWNELGAFNKSALSLDMPRASSATFRNFPRMIPAGAVLLTIVAVALTYFHFRSDPAPIVAYTTGLGEVSDIVLSDSSHVKLGAKSELIVEEMNQERRVSMRIGEAFFEVSPDPSRPFYVDAGGARVRVLGTKFNVHMGPDGVSVAVVEGKVSLETQADAARDRPLRATLESGQAARVTSTRELLRISESDVQRALAWQEGLLIFNDTTLISVASDVNRYSSRSLVIADHEVGNLRVTGLFRGGDFESVIKAIEENLPIDVRTNGDGTFLLEKSGER